MIPTDVRVIGILGVHHFRAEGTLVGNRGALEVFGLHVAEDILAAGGHKAAEEADIAAALLLPRHPGLDQPFPALWK